MSRSPATGRGTRAADGHRRPGERGAPRRGGPGRGESPKAAAASARATTRTGDPEARAAGAGGSRPARRLGGGGGGGSRRPSGVGLANPRRRVRAIFLVVLFVFSIFAAQLVRLQGIDAAHVAEEARDIRTGEPTVIPARRGALTDRFGVDLAKSVERRDVVADQVAVREYTQPVPGTKERRTVGAAGAAKTLAPVLRVDENRLRSQLSGDRRWMPIARQIEPTLWRKVEALDIPGISSEETSVRTYPGGSTSAPVVGWVGADGRASGGSGGGLELLLDGKLNGTPGRMLREYSLDSRVIPMGVNEVTPAVPGQDVRLTIDNDLTWYASSAIAEQVKESNADSGYAVVMDRKGRLLALAQSPTFDPANKGKQDNYFGNLPFQDVFEPGSTAKIMSIGAAMDQGKVGPTSEFTVPNRLKRADRNFRDSHDHETLHLTTAGVLAQSSNIGTILAAEKLAPTMLEQYYRAFGVGQKSSVGFPGESSGLLAKSDSWDASQRYTVAFGQGLSMTAVQAAGVFQTVANGGVRVEPSIVAGTTGPDGAYTPQELPQGKRVLSEKTAKDLSVMLESVVGTGGTAQQAAIAGIPVAGKTGTADRYDAKTGGYSGKTASFIGFAPADKPEFVVAVILQNPRNGYYGGATAGPVFQKVMSYALQRYGVPPTGTKRTPYPLEVGQEPSSDAPQVDPGEIPASGPVTRRAAPSSPSSTPSASPSTSTSGSTPSGEPSASPSGSSAAPSAEATSSASESSSAGPTR